MYLTQRKLHPLVAVAAVSLTLFSLLGIAAITGLVPSARSNNADSFQVAMPISDTDAKKLESQDQATQSKQAKENSKSATNTGTSATASEPVKHTSTAKSESSAKSAVTADSGVKTCLHCGQVAAINLVKQDGEASGLGAVAGGVAGGLVGNQIGKGKGNILMTILGAGGGAYAGHTIEKKVKATDIYVVKVHMNDGSTRTVTMAEKPAFAVGDQVKVINGGVSVVS